MKSLDRILARHFVVVALFTGLAALARVAQEVGIAWRFGISATVDAYSFLMSLVNWPVSIWSSLLTVLLVPVFARLRLNSPDRLTLLRAELLGASLLVAALGGCMFWIGTKLAVARPLVGLSAPILEEAGRMTDALSLAVPLGVLAALFSVWLLASGRHSNTLLESIPPLAVASALILSPAASADALLWGTLVGVGLRLVLAWGLHASECGFARPLLSLSEPTWKGLWRAGAILVLGQALTSVTVIVDQLFAAHLADGAIATLNYANRIVGLFALLGATAIQRATLPILSSAYAAGEASAPRLTLRWTFFGFVAGVAAVAVVIPLAHPLTRLAFERGAFSSGDTRAVSQIASYYAIHLPFYFSSLVIVSVLASRSLYGPIALIAGSNLLVKVISNLVLMPALGLAGIALSSTAMYATSLLLGCLAVERSKWQPARSC